ncbi:MAG: 4Fe-4S binding protein [Acidobacteriota bacterium]|jgi:ferredoxin
MATTSARNLFGGAAAGRLRRLAALLTGRTGRKWHRSFRLRILVQSGFAVTCVLLGVQLARFVAAARSGAPVLPQRPPGVEGFLPIGGLLGIVDWVHQGSLNAVHPAATVLLLTFLAVALLARKSFCSWICPVGFLSDLLARLGRVFFGRNFRIWRWLDVPLRGLKYLLLGFFVWAISRMSAEAVRAFIESPYYRLSDIRMGMFFVELSGFAAGFISLTAAASILWKGFWCRYLCPYGALLGLVSWLSPLKVRRDPVSCIDCGLCDRACASRLPVSRKTAVMSPECTGCLDCVAACPVKDALGIGLPTLAGRVRSASGSDGSPAKGGRPRWLPVPAYAAVILALFFAGYLGARAAGTWDNAITGAEYRYRLRQEAVELYAHPDVDGRVPTTHGVATSR